MSDDELAHLKAALDRERERAPHALARLERTHDLELTHSSTAVEGNTLTAIETTLVVEQGITVAGKPLRDHLEVIDHAGALRYVRDLARRGTVLAELDIRALHRLVMLRSAPDDAGQYALAGRYVLTASGRRAFPAPALVPGLMRDFAAWLGDATPSAPVAFAAHRRLVGIHPFADGKGRTARLLMNLLLLRAGYPPIAVRPGDRVAYLDALQTADDVAFEALLRERLRATLLEYFEAASQAIAR